VRAIWDEDNSKWWFSAVDIVWILSESKDPRNYWKVLKNRLTKEWSEVVTNCNQLKMTASDGKKYLTDVLDSDWIVLLAKNFPNNKAKDFLDWFLYSENSIDGQSRKKAYALFENNLIQDEDIWTIKSLKQIHAYLFWWLYDFAWKIRQKNISKWGFRFATAEFLDDTLKQIELMPENTFDEIINKYVEMNIAHPFMEWNWRTTRIWLDLILKRRLKRCVDRSKINKNDYLSAMVLSVSNSERIKKLINWALTDKIDDRDVFMKWIDYSYYYEEE
jgi:cell filamentation protein